MNEVVLKVIFQSNGSNVKNANYEINLQDVKGDNYLKSHKLINTSTLIKDDNILLSNFDMNLQFKDSSLFSSFKIYEDLSRNFHDRYQYIFPEFSFSKNLDIPRDYNGAFNFNTYGYNKHYETNITEAVLTNDFLFSSYNYINTKVCNLIIIYYWKILIITQTIQITLMKTPNMICLD